MDIFPPAFPSLALAHFVALLSPGPDFFLLVGYAIRLRGSAGFLRRHCLRQRALYFAGDYRRERLTPFHRVLHRH